MVEKRTREIKIRVTDEEYQALLDRKTKPRLAEWLREVALGEPPKRKPKPVNPALLFQLNRIGVNLNQIAKYCNTQPAHIELVAISLSLKELAKTLAEVREMTK